MRISCLRPTIVGVAVLVASCGGSGGTGAVAAPGERAQLVAAAPDRLHDAATARIAFSVSTVGLGDGTQLLEAEGTVDLRTGDGLTVMDMSGLGIPGFGNDIEVRVVDRVVYMDFGSLAGVFGPTGPDFEWLKIDLPALSEDLGIDAADLGLGATGADFTGVFDMLRDVSDGIEDLGREDVRDGSATHYRVDVDLQDVIDQGLAQLPPELVDLIDPGAIAGALPLVPVDLWIDDDGLPRKMQLTIAFSDLVPDAAELADTAMTVAMDLYDFGVEVDVEAPPASATADMLDVIGGPLGGLGA